MKYQYNNIFLFPYSRNPQEEILPEQIIWTKLYKSISMIRKARLVWLKRPPPRQKLQNEKRPKRKLQWNLGMELEGICHLMIQILEELLLGKSFLLEHLRKDPRHLRKPQRKHRKNTVKWYFILHSDSKFAKTVQIHFKLGNTRGSN